jgi:hypothetical protein
MKLHKLEAVVAFGLCILSALANANAAEDRSTRPFNAPGAASGAGNSRSSSPRNSGAAFRPLS